MPKAQDIATPEIEAKRKAARERKRKQRSKMSTEEYEKELDKAADGMAKLRQNESVCMTFLGKRLDFH